MNKKCFAKEWLYFVGLFLFGLLFLPLLICILVGFFTQRSFSECITGFYPALVSKNEWWAAWLFVVGPYILFQFVRSVVWAWKAVRSK